MQTQELFDRFAPQIEELGFDAAEFIAKLRAERSGTFGVQTFRRTADWRDVKETARERFTDRYAQAYVDRMAVAEANRIAREATSEVELSPNLVTNEGLAHVLSSTLDAGTQVTTWQL